MSTGHYDLGGSRVARNDLNSGRFSRRDLFSDPFSKNRPLAEQGARTQQGEREGVPLELPRGTRLSTRLNGSYHLACSSRGPSPQRGKENPIEEALPTLDVHLAQKCTKFFEIRLQISQRLQKRWSYLEGSSSSKTPIEHKMEFLRREIAGLMSQDDALYRQLLTLNEAISSLKTAPPRHLLRAPSPASLDSFTDEEEEEDHEQVSFGEKSCGQVQENPFDVDEGLDTDHSTSLTSTLSSRDSHFSHSKAQTASLDWSPNRQGFQRAITSPHQSHSTAPAHLVFMRCRKSYAPNARNRRRSSSAHLAARADGTASRADAPARREALIM